MTKRARGPFRCLHCAKEYFTRRSPGEGEKYCSRACAFSGRRNEQRGAVRFCPVYFRGCAHCADLFTARFVHQIVCGPRCRTAYAGSYGKRVDTRNRAPRLCKECGAAFSPRYGDKHRAFCSDQCSYRWNMRIDLGRLDAQRPRFARLRKLRLRGGAAIDPVRIFERDGWRCGVCGGLVDKDAEVPDHAAPTIDHRVPLAAGGAHVEGNVQCAHFICNVRKATKPPIGGLQSFGPRDLDRPWPSACSTALSMGGGVNDLSLMSHGQTNQTNRTEGS